ncbi:hypothetical protein AB4K20DRAFT_1806941 [Rhizopus microsporus]|uniref:Uncharacterized protein n=1 Tax=Rhizopus microsporus TaxID=58291 RepID=A0A1X0S4P2_RHIZD|nr:hypothetical protein BCV71DRAFT_234279 [Rhizopus microsporus]
MNFQLYLLDFEKRMHLSAIFGSEAAASVEFNIAKLSDSVLTNCFDLKKTIQLDSLYQSTHHATTMEQLFFNSILTSAFLQHGRVAMKKNWIWRGEKAGVSESLITEARIRALETMERQLHLHLKHLNTTHSSKITFSLIVKITLKKTHATYDKGKLPAIRPILKHYMEDIKKECKQTASDQRATLSRLQMVFTASMLQTLRNAEASNDDNIWSLYKSWSRPTPSGLLPIYEEQHVFYYS